MWSVTPLVRYTAVEGWNRTAPQGKYLAFVPSDLKQFEVRNTSKLGHSAPIPDETYVQSHQVNLWDLDPSMYGIIIMDTQSIQPVHDPRCVTLTGKRRAKYNSAVRLRMCRKSRQLRELALQHEVMLIPGAPVQKKECIRDVYCSQQVKASRLP